MDIYEKIEHYVAGDMPEEERTAFEQQLQTDPALKQQWQVYSQLHEYLKNKESIAAGEISLRNSMQEAIDEQKAAAIIAAKVIPLRKKWIAAVAAAAAIIILVLVVRIAFFAPPTDSKILYAQYDGFEKLSVTNRGSEADSLLDIAATHFNNKNYKQALPALDLYLKANPNQAHYQLARGYALMQTGDYKAAEQDLLQVQNGSSSYVSQAKWYRALAQLKQGNGNAAKAILFTIDNNEENYQQAQEILKKL